MVVGLGAAAAKAAAKAMTAAKAKQEAETLGKIMGVTRKAYKTKGNLTLSGEFTKSETDAIVKAWLGPNVKPFNNKKGWINEDGLRTYREANKKNSSYSTTGIQANLKRS